MVSTVQLDTLGSVIEPTYKGERPNGTVYMSTQGAGPDKTESENQTALQDALDLIETMMGGDGVIYYDVPGEYDINTASKVGGINNLVIDGAPGVILNGENVDYLTDKSIIELSGVELPTTTITAAITKGDTVWQVTSTTGLVAGMPFYIRSNDEYFNGAAGVSGFGLVRKMEMNRIESVGPGNQITVQNPAEDDYSITGHIVTLTPFTPIKSFEVTENIFFKGGGIKATIDNGKGQRAISISLFLKADFTRMKAGGWQGYVSLAQLGFNASYNGGSIYGLDDQMPSTNFYGHVASGVSGVEWAGIFGRNMRRVVDTGTGYITRHFEQSGIMGMNLNGSCVGSHHGDYGQVYSNYVLNAATGITVRSKNTHVYNNYIKTNGIGISFGSASVTAPTSINNMGKCSSVGNIVTTNAGGSTRYGLQVTLGYDEFINENNTYETENSSPVWIQCYQINNYKASGNTFKTNSGTVDGHVIDNSTSILVTIDGVDIGRNTFIGDFDEVIKIAAPNSGSYLQNISIETQHVVGTFATMYSIDRSRTGTFINLATGQLADGAHSGFRNIVVNGSGLVNERQGTGSNVTSTTAYPLDRWALTAAGQSLRMTQGSTSLPLDDVSGWIIIQTRLVPVGAPAAADKYAMEQAFIGFDFASLKWGTDNALPVTLAFFVRPVVDTSGNSTYSYAIQNGARDRSYVKNYTGNNGNVRLIINTVPGDKTGTWATDDTAGARLVFDLGSGSNFEATADSWQAGNYIRTSGSYRLIENAQFRTISFGGINLERGANFSGFERRPISIEKDLCRPFFIRAKLNVPTLPAMETLQIDMITAPASGDISGAGAGYDITGTTANTLLIGQTIGALQTLLINNEPTF